MNSPFTQSIFEQCVFIFTECYCSLLDEQAMMGLIYLVFIALNKDQGPRGGGDTNSSRGGGDTNSLEDPLEEARRIMEKYK